MFSTSRDPSCSPYSVSYNAKCSNTCSTSVGNGSTGATGAQGATGNSLIGVTTIDGNLENGATITTGQYLQLGVASQTYPGIMTTTGQTFGGSKTFTSDLLVNTLTVGKGGGAQTANTAIGNLALSSNTTGTHNTAVGANAGTGNSTASYNTFLGYQTTTTDGFTNSTAIGSYSTITTNNQVVLGTTAETVSLIGGILDIPTYKTKSQTTNLGYQLITTGSSTSITSGTTYDLTSQTISPGVWIVNLNDYLNATNSPTLSQLRFGLSTSSTSFTGSPNYQQTYYHDAIALNNGDTPIYNSSFTIVVSTSTTYYFVATATFSTGGGAALSMTGTIIITKIA